MRESNPYPAQPPRPVPTEESALFWSNAAEGRLVLKTCEPCGRSVAPLAPRCPKCLSAALSSAEFSGRAFLKGRTTLHIPAYFGQQTPYVLVEVALVEDPSLVLIAVDPNGVTNGLKPEAAIRISFAPPLAQNLNGAILAAVQAEDAP